MQEFVTLPVEPTEEMIRAACLNQCDEPFDSYEKWADSHTTGIVERIRGYVVKDYKSMVGAYIIKESK